MAVDPMNDSTSFEKLVEHVFVSELLQEIWFQRGQAAEVLRAEVDSWGYDIVVELQGRVRHIQLKTSRAGSKTRKVNVHERLGQKPGGCVVWIVWHHDEERHRIHFDEYRWYGSKPGKPCPALTDLKLAKHERANAKGQKAFRRAKRVLPRSKCEIVSTMPELATRLFGRG